MSAAKVQRLVEDTRVTLTNTSPALAIPYIVPALEEVAKTLLEYENKSDDCAILAKEGA
jgi:hypothetical protein